EIQVAERFIVPVRVGQCGQKPSPNCGRLPQKGFAACLTAFPPTGVTSNRGRPSSRSPMARAAAAMCCSASTAQPPARHEYARVRAEWEANGRRQIAPVLGADLTINELIRAFWDHVEQHYRRPDGTPTSEVADYKLSLRPLKHLYGDTTANGVGPLALK